jgi:hypothetical protein
MKMKHGLINMETYEGHGSSIWKETWNMKHGTGNIVLWNINMKL